MVVLGSWPYSHTLTLDQMRRQTKVVMYYFVDSDKIISADEASHLRQKGHLVDEELLTVMSEELAASLVPYSEQNFPPPIPSLISSERRKNANPSLTEKIQRVQNSSAVLLVNEQSSELMEDMGAIWNNELSLWIMDGISLRNLREKKRQRTDGKVRMKQDRGGVLVEISGDVTPHVQLLQDAGGKYDDEKDVWFVPIKSIHKIVHIVSR